MYKARLIELREAAASAQRAAVAIRDEMKAAGITEWPADKREQYDKCIADFNTAHTEFQRVKVRADAETQMESAAADYNTPAREVQTRGQGGGEDSERKQKQKEVFNKLIRHGEAGCKPGELQALLGSDQALGGFHVPDDFNAQVIKDLAGFAVIRSGGATVVTTTRDTYVAPTFQSGTNPRPTGYTGSWRTQGYITGGTAPTVQNQPLSGEERIPVHTWQPDAIEITQELLEDAASDLEGALAQIIAETKALDEDEAFLTGNGVGRPEGILNSGASTVKSGSNSNILYGGLVDLFVALPAQYRQNAKWIMNSVTYGAVLKLEDTAGNPIIPPNSMPGTLWGKPILFSEFLANPTTQNNKPIIFGDLRFYWIAERRSLSIQRLIERYAPNVGILPMARIGGQAVRTSAFRIQNVSA